MAGLDYCGYPPANVQDLDRMRRSESWHFLLCTLATVLEAVVVVGPVTLILVDASFSSKEEH